jgi:hypothetical protein
VRYVLLFLGCYAVDCTDVSFGLLRMPLPEEYQENFTLSLYFSGRCILSILSFLVIRTLPRPQSLSKGGVENEKKFFVGRARNMHCPAMISQPLMYIVCNCTALCPTKGLRRRQIRTTYTDTDSSRLYTVVSVSCQHTLTKEFCKSIQAPSKQCVSWSYHTGN